MIKIKDLPRHLRPREKLIEKGPRERGKTVVMSAEELDSWRETRDVMREMPDLKEDIEKAEEEFRLGKTVSLDEILAKEKFATVKKAIKKARANHESKKNNYS